MRFWFLVGVWLWSLPMWSQAWQVQRLVNDQTLDFFIGKTDTASVFQDSLTAFQSIRQWKDTLVAQGYLAAALDNWDVENRRIKAEFHLGPLFNEAILQPGNVPSKWLQRAGYRAKKSKDYRQWIQLVQSLLKVAANNGYPFAVVTLEDILVAAEGIEATLHIEKGNFVKIQGLILNAESGISSTYVQQIIGIKSGDTYTHQKVLNIPQRIKEMPFVSLEKDPIVLFNAREANIQLQLRPKKASRFDFLIGVLPNSDQFSNRSVLITGSMTADLINQFGKGERLFTKIERTRPETFRLDASVDYPYIASLPFGADLDLHLYRRDSSYVDVRIQAGGRYLMEGGGFVKVFWQGMGSRVLSVNESLIIQSKKLPTVLDLTANGLGISYQVQRLDYRWNPRKGWSFEAEVVGGRRKVERNSLITDLRDPNNIDFDFGTLYDTTTLQNGTARLSMNLATYVPIGRQMTFKWALSGGTLQMNAPVLLNDQYRLGGLLSWRGFDEESLFATHYAKTTLEMRLLTGGNGYLFAFAEGGWLKGLQQQDRPTGFGAGITFDTDAGLFALTYAYGIRKNVALNPSAAKIHFGYINLF